MEAELFGVEASADQPPAIGALEQAHSGTLYLDEIADMPRETQAKILRVLVDQNFRRVGGASRVFVDVRIISSTSRDLAEAITEGRFREDLFHRLSVVPNPDSVVGRAAGGHSRTRPIFSEECREHDGCCAAPRGRGRHGGAAIP